MGIIMGRAKFLGCLKQEERLPVSGVGKVGMVAVLEVAPGMVSVFLQFMSRFAVMLGDAYQYLWPGGDSFPIILLREKSTSPKGGAVGHAENMQGPAGRLVEHPHGFHVGLVKIRAFFPVDFNTNKMTVHDGCDIGILKILLGHPAAPMAGSVAY